jgi:U5 small nuclear ribonucleoprotein component
MASLEDYDEFGNYIGADLASDDEDDFRQDDMSRNVPGQPALAGYDEEPRIAAAEDALMEVDGSCCDLYVFN